MVLETESGNIHIASPWWHPQQYLDQESQQLSILSSQGCFCVQPGLISLQLQDGTSEPETSQGLLT